MRVKIYLCMPDGNWVDYVIGYLQLVVEEEHGAAYLRVIEQSTSGGGGREVSEEVKQKLVSSGEASASQVKWAVNLRVLHDTKYERQGDNIITWFEPEIQEDIAVSFIDHQYTKDIYSQIEAVQGKRNAHFKFDEIEASNVIVPTHHNLDAFITQIQEHPEHVVQQLVHRVS